MSLPIATLLSIQKVGSAAFSADTKLKHAVKDYAGRVNAAIMNNPYNIGNDTLIENWKTVARLSQTLVNIEEELKKVYQVASELTDDNQSGARDVLTLAAPAPSVGEAIHPVSNVKAKRKYTKSAVKTTAAETMPMEPSSDLSPTDVLAKTKKRQSKLSVKPKKKTAGPKLKVKKAKTQDLAFSGNTAKLLSYFERTLTPNTSSAISQTAAAKETGIPLGSMTASVKKLIAAGRLIMSPDGGFRLADTSSSAQSAA